MSLNTLLGDSNISTYGKRDGSKVVPVWYPSQGIFPSAFPSSVHVGHRLGDLNSISSWEVELINETTAFQVGKQRADINDGSKFVATLEVWGNALAIQAAIIGQDMTKTKAIRQGQSIIGAGTMSCLTGNDSNRAIGSEVFPNCQVKLTNIAGAEDGQSYFNVELSTTSDVYKTLGYLTYTRELWFEGTSPADGSTAITNAAAPDGILTAFKLGTGNHSGLSSQYPLAQSFNPSASGADEYLLEVKVNGSSVSGYTYDTATSTINFTSAPAANAILEVGYFVRSGAEAWDSNKKYGIGSVVSYNNSYYVGNASSTGSIPPATGWAAYTGFGWDGVPAGIATPVIPYNTSDEFYFMEAWSDVLNA